MACRSVLSISRFRSTSVRRFASKLPVLKRADGHAIVPYTARSNVDKIVFTGIQPSGSLHLGNYFGVVSKLLQFQDAAFVNLYVSVVDLHALTERRSPHDYHETIVDMFATLLACGIDPKRCCLFQQSSVGAHTQLAWLLGAQLCSVAMLQRMTQYKEKAARFKVTEGEVPLGVLSYPVLQAADILLYRATNVPVGEDQVQHLQLARDLAKGFNARYGVEYFPVPEVVPGEVPRLRSLRSPEKKMSKSDAEPRARINVLDEPEVVRDRCKKALTDFVSDVTYEPEYRPAVSNLVLIYSLVTGKAPEVVWKEAAARAVTTAEFKMELADAVVEYFRPVRECYKRLRAEPEYVCGVVEEGNRKANEEAGRTMEDVRSICGMELRAEVARLRIGGEKGGARQCKPSTESTAMKS